MSIESVMPSNHLVLYHPLLLPPSIFPSIRVFSKELVLHIRWPKYWSFSFSISPSNEYSGLIFFQIDWFAVRGTLESSPTPQFKSVNFLALSFLYSPILTSIHDYWKNHSFDYRRTLVGKVMSLLFNMLSRLVITFLICPYHICYLPPKTLEKLITHFLHLCIVRCDNVTVQANDM